jgi:hypothetical protein
MSTRAPGPAQKFEDKSHFSVQIFLIFAAEFSASNIKK